MILIDKTSDLSAWTSRDGTRPAPLHGVQISAAGVTATDGHVLATMPLQAQHEHASDGPSPVLPVTIPAEALAAAMKRVPKACRNPSRTGVGITTNESGHVVLTTWDKDGCNPVATTVQPIDGPFPPFLEILPTSAPTARIIVDPAYLEKLAKYARAHSYLGRVVLEIRGLRDPLIGIVDLPDARDATLAIMPQCRGPVDERLETPAQKHQEPTGARAQINVAIEAARSAGYQAGRTEAMQVTAQASREKIRAEVGAEIGAEIERLRAEIKERDRSIASILALTDSKDHVECQARVEALCAGRDTIGDAVSDLYPIIGAGNEVEKVERLVSEREELGAMCEEVDLKREWSQGHDIALDAIKKQLEEYGSICETLGCDDDKTVLDKAKELAADAVDGAAALSVVEAAAELMRDLDWERPNPRPLENLRDALRECAKDSDKIPMPALRFDA